MEAANRQELDTLLKPQERGGHVQVTVPEAADTRKIDVGCPRNSIDMEFCFFLLPSLSYSVRNSVPDI